MNQFVEFEGKNIDQALARASDELGTPVERLEYDVVSYGSSGIFGLVGAKKAKIRVKSKKLMGIAKETRQQARDLVKDAFQLDEEVVPSEQEETEIADSDDNDNLEDGDDEDQRQMPGAGTVQPFVELALGRCAVANHTYGDARLATQLERIGHSDGMNAVCCDGDA